MPLTFVGHTYLKVLPTLVGLGTAVKKAINEEERGAPDISLGAQIQTALARAQLRQLAAEGDQTAMRLLAQLDAAPAEREANALRERQNRKAIKFKAVLDKSFTATLHGLVAHNVPSNTSRVRFSFQSNGAGGVHGSVESTTERDGDQLIIIFRNRTGNDLFLTTSTGTPSVSIAAIKLASGNPQRFSIRRYDQTSRDRYGSQVYQVPATPWIQMSSAAGRIADYLLAVAASPLPILGDVEILPDPRLQLGDLVRVVDDVGAALSTPAWIVGNNTSGDDTGRIRQVLTLRATASPGPPADAGLTPDPQLAPDARAQLLREGIRVP